MPATTAERRWRYRALLDDGRTAADPGGARSEWPAMKDELERRGGFVRRLVLEGGPCGARVEMPPSPLYYHLKRARCAFPSSGEAELAYAVGFLAGDEVVLVWGMPDGGLTVERRPAASMPAAATAPGVR